MRVFLLCFSTLYTGAYNISPQRSNVFKNDHDILLLYAKYKFLSRVLIVSSLVTEPGCVSITNQTSYTQGYIIAGTGY
jgi:hypothetical protein